ncbi:MAG: insulinase family protein [Flavipsychrobacter sp.]
MQHFTAHFFKRVIAAMLLLVSFAGMASAQDLNTPLPIDPKVKKGKFDNGLTYYIKTNKKPENKVELRLVINAGSILEDDDQQGLAHFMEHMNFNGSKNFPKNELVSYLQSIGVEFGADLNAYTSFDETVYILPIPTDKEGNLDKGFQIIEDWAHNALLTDKDIDDERGVVLEESRLAKGAQMRMMRKYLPELMAGSRYAERLPIGKDDILKTFKYETIRRFYRDWYRPDLMAVAVVGDIDEATAMKYLKKHFATLENPKNEKKRFDNPLTPRKKASAMVLTDKEATNYQLQIMFPSVKQKVSKVVGDYRDHMVQGLMQQVINQRLRDLSQSANPPFPFAAASISGWARGYESLMAFTMFGEEGPEKAMMALTAELKKAVEYGFTEKELELAKKDMMAFMEKAYNERNTTESSRLIGEYVRNFLEGETIPGIENEYRYYKELLPGIKAEELNAEIKKWMSNTNTFSLITGPESGKEKLPTEAELLAMTQKGLAQKVTQNVEENIATSLMANKPRAGKVTNTKEEKALGATTYTLSNGVKVTIKSTDFKSDEIVLRGVKNGGSNNYGAADVNNVKYATSVTDAMGFGQFNPTQIEKVLAGKNIRANVSIGEIHNTISASSTVKDVEEMFQLLYIKLTQPRIDKELYGAYIKKQMMQVKFMSANPTFAFIDTMYGEMYAHNPLAPSPLPKAEQFENLDMNRAVEIYRNEFGMADGMNFYIVGNVDAEKMLPLIETYLGGLPANKQMPKYKDNGVRPVSGNHTVKFYKGADAKSMIVSVTHGEAKFSEDFSLQASALSEILNIKVIEELREKLGGIYGGGYRASVEDEPYGNYSFSLQLPCGPENVDKLIAAADEVVKDLKANGPSAEDLDKVKNQWREKHRENMEKNSYWAGKLQSILFLGRDQDHMLNYDQWIDALTTNDIKKVANKVFDGKNTFTAILYPESEKK